VPGHATHARAPLRGRKRHPATSVVARAPARRTVYPLSHAARHAVRARRRGRPRQRAPGARQRSETPKKGTTSCPPTHHPRRRGRPGRRTAAKVTCARCQTVRNAPTGSTPQRRRGSARVVGGFRQLLRALRPPPQADRRRRASLRPGGSEARCRVRNRGRNGAAHAEVRPGPSKQSDGPASERRPAPPRCPSRHVTCGTARPAWRLAAVMTSARGVPPHHPVAALTCT
jgi:hypothetical protein